MRGVTQGLNMQSDRRDLFHYVAIFSLLLDIYEVCVNLTGLVIFCLSPTLFCIQPRHSRCSGVRFYRQFYSEYLIEPVGVAYAALTWRAQLLV